MGDPGGALAESCRGHPGYGRHERKRRVEEIEQSKSRQLVEHEQQPMRAALGLEVLGERWLRINRTCGLVRLMSYGGTTS